MRAFEYSIGDSGPSTRQWAVGFVLACAAVACWAWTFHTESGGRLVIPAGISILFAMTFHLRFKGRRGWRRLVPTASELAIAFIMVGIFTLVMGTGVWLGPEADRVLPADRAAYLKVGLSTLAIGASIIPFIF